jgi:hypothetical protein
MNFSAILDISSFFIGMIINLLLIALICYYFKRKYENLEIAQNEQAKVLYQLLQQNSSPKVMNLNDILKDEKKSSLSDLDSDESDESDSDSDAESESDIAFDSNDKIKTINLDKHADDLDEVEMEDIQVQKVQKVEPVDIDLVKVETESKDIVIEMDELDDKESEKDYSKMSIKQLKEILSVKGIVPTKMKKNEMIELIEKSSVTIDDENE